MKDYRAMIDFKFLKEFDIKVNQSPKCPWQFFVTHPDLDDGAKFVFYPSTGSLVYETEDFREGKMNAQDGEELMELVMSKVKK